MIAHRRQFGLWVGSALLAGLPFPAAADPGDVVTQNGKPEGHRGTRIDGAKHGAGPVKADFLRYQWSIDMRSNSIAEDQWKYDFPEHGQASVLIDDKGDWQFQGAFPKGPLVLPCRVTVGLDLTGRLGKVFSFAHEMRVFRDGASWAKSGHDAIVGDLWQDVAPGHAWQWWAHAHQEQPAEPPPQDCMGFGGILACGLRGGF